MDHPWRRLRAMADWLLEWAHLPGDLQGFTDWDTQVITMDRGLLQVERRCTIAHELEHIHRGRAPEDPVLRAREEESVDRAVARRLIPFRKLADALAWSQDREEVADELWVDVPTLEARLRGLHPSERAELRRRMEHHD